MIVTASCMDNAGKAASPSVSINYDDTPPTITGATPSRAPDSNGYYTSPVTFQFTGVDAVSGIASCDTVTYSGPSSGAVVGGCHDQAGNYATISVPVNYQAAAPPASATPLTSATPLAPSTPLAPTTHATARQSPPVLRWKPARKATYYNVQIYRSGKKILSMWPTKTRLALRQSWSFRGHKFRLKPGRYRWYVWPGYGSRKTARYGRMLVSSSFKVTKLV